MALPADLETLGAQILAELEERELGQDSASRRRARAAEELAKLVQTGFMAAHDYRQATISGKKSLTRRLQDCRRQRDGEYDPDKLAKIQAAKGADVFMNLTEPKCASLVAWVNRIVREKFFLLEPTTISELPQEALDEIAAQLRPTLMQAVAALDAGQLTKQEAEAALASVAAALEKQRTKQISREARERAEALQKKVEDQLEEGGFTQSWNDFLEFLSTYPYAILRGPIVRMERRGVWRGGKYEVEDQPVMTFEAIHPDDFYPGPNMTDLDHGDCYQTARFDPVELEASATTKGWDAEAIAAVLSDPAPPTSVRAYLAEELERARAEGRDTSTNDGVADGLLTGVWCYRTVRRQTLVDWGAAWAEDERGTFLDVCLLLIGTRIVYAAKNPDPLGRRPYHLTSFLRIPGQLVGKGLPEVVEAPQGVFAAAWRNAVDNGAFASRPVFAYDYQAIDPACNPKHLVGGKAFPFDGDKIKYAGQDLIKFHNIPNAIPQLLRLAEAAKGEADNLSRIPAFVYGEADVAGAGQTMGGLSMLMNNSAMGIEQLIGNLDTYVIKRLISMVCDWDMLYLPDDQWGHVKGDVRVVARGALALMVQNAADERLPEMVAQASKDPHIFSLIGLEGLAKLLREMYRRFNIPGLEIVPDEDEVKELAAALPAAQHQPLADSPVQQEAAANG
jgi:hypothetical protein